MVLLSDHYNLGYLMLAIYQGLSLAPITSQVINNYEQLLLLSASAML